MIVVRLCGGLGNQLFQYAAGRRLAYARQTELILDLRWYVHTPSVDTPRQFELDNYPIIARGANAREALWCRVQSGRLLRHLPLIPRRWRYVSEPGCGFDPSILDLPGNVYLDGYWQSAGYFEDIADIIRAELTPSVPATPKDAEVRDAILASESVSVHVRRGDYVTLQAAAATHGTCAPSYYHAALELIASRVRNPHFFIFSDDVAWARENLTPPGPVTIVDHNGPKSAFQDLRLMARCKHHVVANSSFSWWGAWLNPSKDKIVVAPAKWLRDGRPTPALIPNTWTRL